MSKKQLWNDKKIEDVSAPGVIAGNGGRFINLVIATDMRNDYEHALAFRNEDIGRLQGELKIATARIAELEAMQQWQPMTHGRHRDGVAHIQVVYEGKMINVGFADEDGSCEFSIRLPDDIRLCRKVQPAA